MDRSLCAFGIDLRLGRDERADKGCALARQEALHPEWREDVDYECELRRPLHRVRKDRWRKVFSVHRGANVPRILRWSRREENGNSRLIDRAADPERLQSSGRES